MAVAVNSIDGPLVLLENTGEVGNWLDVAQADETASRRARGGSQRRRLRHIEPLGDVRRYVTMATM